ncbi:TetR family transcriptional regulator C-terminal domain-containing protein [Streptomyces sp. T-3]|nr:TetR family transcriptional regulator C-terminal domain-containing protein [Streptomyces sp. T-3]
MSDRQELIMEAAVRVIARSGVRGLRVEKLAAEAGVSTALIYYHFKDRAGLIRRTLEFVSDRAGAYTDAAITTAQDARAELEQMLLMELQDTEQVRENSTAWGELRASAVFETELQDALATSTRTWTDETAEAIRAAQDAGLARAAADPQATAQRLTALVEGISMRWLSGSLTLEQARELLLGAIELELGTR